QRDRPGLKIEEREDAALELAQDAGGGSRSAQAVDEDRGRSVHTVHLENSERSVNTVRRVLAAPVVARRCALGWPARRSVSTQRRAGAAICWIEPGAPPDLDL